MSARILVRLALLGAVVALVAGPGRGALSAGSPRPAASLPPVPTDGLPPQIGELVSRAGVAQRQSLAGRLGALGRRGVGDRAAAAPVRTAQAPFADRGSRRQISRLRRDVLDALRAASTTDDRVTVAAWQGVFVTGHRAAALVDLERAVRTRAGLPFRRLPLTRTRLGLVRERGRWRIAAGAPSA